MNAAEALDAVLEGIDVLAREMPAPLWPGIRSTIFARFYGATRVHRWAAIGSTLTGTLLSRDGAMTVLRTADGNVLLHALQKDLAAKLADVLVGAVVTITFVGIIRNTKVFTVTTP